MHREASTHNQQARISGRNLRLADIDLLALQHNLKIIRQTIPTATQVLAMVKSDAYGHGLLPVAKFLSGQVDGFGVATIEAAAQLRQAGIQNKIVLLCGLCTPGDVAEVQGLALDVVVFNSEQVAWLAAAQPNRPLTVWLKINTGMHRLGCEVSETAALYQQLQACPAVQAPMILMSHFSAAERLDAECNHQQSAQFAAATSGLLGLRSLAHSAGIFAHPDSHFDWVRPGLALYGASPWGVAAAAGQDDAQTRSAAALGLRPVMRLSSCLLAIRDVPAGGVVGYGVESVCNRPTRVGIVAIGYGDGYPRSARPGTPVWVAGQRCPLIGRVSMDMLTVDLTACPQAQVHDEVVLWGPELPIEVVAWQADTIPYELTCQLTARVARRYQTLHLASSATATQARAGGR